MVLILQIYRERGRARRISYVFEKKRKDEELTKSDAGPREHMVSSSFGETSTTGPRARMVSSSFSETMTTGP
jgi:hypothetical protein